MNIFEFIHNNGTKDVPNPNYKKNNGQPPVLRVKDYDADAPNAGVEMAIQDFQNQWKVDSNEIEKYRKYGLNYTPLDRNLDKELADSQSNWSKAFNALGQTLVSELAIGTVMGFSDLASFVTSSILHITPEDYQNPVSKELQKWQDTFNEKIAPVYADPNVNIQNGGLTDFGWWMKGIPQVASTLTLLIPARAISSGVSALGRAARVGARVRIARRWATNVGRADKAAELTGWRAAINRPDALAKFNYGSKLIGEATLMRTMENYQEARDTHTQTYELASQKLKGMSPEDYDMWLQANQDLLNEMMNSGIDINDKDEVAKHLARKAADRTFSMDFANAIFDVIQLHGLNNIGRNIKQASGRTVRQAHKQSKEAAKQFATGEVPKAVKPTFIKRIGNNTYDFFKANGKFILQESTEGIEEAVNYIAQQEGITYGKLLLEGANKDPYQHNRFTGVFHSWNNMQGSLTEYIKTPELQESAFWGVFGGWLFGAGGNVLNNVQTASRLKALQEKRKVNPITGETLNDKGDNALSWFELFEMGENYAGKAAITQRQARLTQASEDLKAIGNNKDIFAELEEGEDIPNFSGTDEEIEIKKTIARQKVISNYVNNLVMDAMNSGTYNMLIDYFKSDAVKKAMVKAGISTEAEIDAYTEQIVKTAEEAKELYNLQSAHILNQLSLLNADKDWDNDDVSLVFAQQIAKDNTEKLMLAKEVDDIITSLELKEGIQLELNRQLNIQEDYATAKETVKLAYLIDKYTQLNAELRDLEEQDKAYRGISTTDPIIGFQRAELQGRRETIKKQLEQTTNELKNITLQGNNAGSTALFLALKNADVVREKLPDGKRRIDESFERTDEEILKDVDRILGGTRTVSDETVIQHAKASHQTLSNILGENGFIENNKKLIDIYGQLTAYHSLKDDILSSIIKTQTEIRTEVSRLNNKMSAARVLAINKATDIIKKAYVENRRSGIIESVLAARRGNIEEARKLAELYLPTDSSNGHVTASELIDAITILNLSKPENADLYFELNQYLAMVERELAQSDPVDDSDETVINAPTQPQNSQPSNNTPSPQNAPTQAPTAPKSNSNAQQSQTPRPRKNLRVVVNNAGKITTVKSADSKNNNISGYVNDDGSVELDSETKTANELMPLIRSGYFEIDDDVDFMEPGKTWEVVANPVLAKRNKDYVVVQRGRISRIKPESTQSQNPTQPSQPSQSNQQQPSQPTQQPTQQPSAPIQPSAPSTPVEDSSEFSTQTPSAPQQVPRQAPQQDEHKTAKELDINVGDKVKTKSNDKIWTVKEIHSNGTFVFVERLLEKNGKQEVSRLGILAENLTKVEEEPEKKEEKKPDTDSNNEPNKLYDNPERLDEIDPDITETNGFKVGDTVTHDRHGEVKTVTILGFRKQNADTFIYADGKELRGGYVDSITGKVESAPQTQPSASTRSEADIERIYNTIGRMFNELIGNDRFSPNLDMSKLSTNALNKVPELVRELAHLNVSEKEIVALINKKIEDLKAARKYMEGKSSLEQSAASWANAAKYEESDNTNYSALFLASARKFMEEYKKVVVVPTVNGKQVVRLVDILRMCNKAVGTNDGSLANAIYSTILNYLTTSEDAKNYIVLDLNDCEQAVADSTKSIEELEDENDVKFGSFDVDIMSYISQINANGIDEQVRKDFYEILDNLKKGDKLNLVVTDEELLLEKDSVVIGRMPFPKMTPNGYRQINQSWVYEIALNANGDPISRTKDIIDGLFTGTSREHNQLHQLLSKLVLNKTITKEDIAAFESNPLISALYKQAVLESKGDNPTNILFTTKKGEINSKQVLTHLLHLWQYVIQTPTEETIEQNRNALSRNLNRWFKKLYNTYDAVNNTKENTEVTITNITDGQLIRITDNTVRDYNKLSYPTESLDDIDSNNARVAIVSPKQPGYLFTSNKPIIPVNGESIGSTYVVIYNRNSQPDYVKAIGLKLSEYDKTGVKNKMAGINVAVANYLIDALNNYISKNNSANANDLLEAFRNVIACNGDNRISLYRGFNGRFDVKIEYDNIKGNEKQLVLRVNFYNNNAAEGNTFFNILLKSKYGRVQLGYQYEENRKREQWQYQSFDENKKNEPNGSNKIAHTIIEKLFNVVLFKHANIDISQQGIQLDNDSRSDVQGKGFFSKKNGKLQVSIPNSVEGKSYNEEFDSYNDYLIKQNLIKVNHKKNEKGRHYESRGSKQSANQKLSVSLPIREKQHIPEEALQQPQKKIIGNDPNTILDLNNSHKDVANEVKTNIENNKKTAGLDIVRTILGEEEYNKIQQIAEEFGVIDTLLPSRLMYDYRMNLVATDPKTGKKVVKGAFAYAKTKSAKYRIYDNRGKAHTPDISAKERIVVGPRWLAKASSPLLSDRKEAIRKLIHEQLHISIWEGSNEERKELYDSVEEIYNEFLNELEKLDHDSKAYKQLKSLDKVLKSYGRDTRLEEFLVESMTNEGLFNFLNFIKTEDVNNNKPDSLFTRIIKALAKFFGWEINDKSLFMKELNILRNIAGYNGTTSTESDTSTETSTEEQIESDTESVIDYTEPPVEETVDTSSPSTPVEDNSDTHVNKFDDMDMGDEIYDDEIYDDEEYNEDDFADASNISEINITPKEFYPINNLSSFKQTLPLDQHADFTQAMANGNVEYRCR